jgi:cytoplasmic FMR1 interacting protein
LKIFIYSFRIIKSLPTFTERIRKFQILNQQIFACLNKYLCHTTTDEIPVEQVKCLTPMTLQTIQYVNEI